MSWDNILAIALGVHAVAAVIVNVTPTPKDNEVLGKIYKVIELAAGVTARAKEGK